MEELPPFLIYNLQMLQVLFILILHTGILFRMMMALLLGLLLGVGIAVVDGLLRTGHII